MSSVLSSIKYLSKGILTQVWNIRIKIILPLFFNASFSIQAVPGLSSNTQDLHWDTWNLFTRGMWSQFLTKDWTPVLCIGGWSLSHWTTREIPYLLFLISCWVLRASLVAQSVKNLPAMQETWVQFLGQEDPLEKEMATCSSILTWRIPMDRGAWQATVHGVAMSRTWLSDFTFFSLSLSCPF